MNFSKFALVAFTAATVPAYAVVTPETALTYNASTSSYTVDWYGSAGHTYFIQHSLDLMTWQTAPVIESGVGAALSWTIQLTADRTFFRVLASDLPTGGNPQTADFDGDGLSNLTEINLGANPISLDSDRDGMPDAWEYLYGFNLTQPGATENEDGDALTNLGEYLGGTNPNTDDDPIAAAALGLVVLSH